MDIILTPQVRDGHIVVYKYKDTLIINNEEFDFSRLREGEYLPSHAVKSEYIVGEVKREDGDIVVSLILPVRWDSPSSAMYPEAIEKPEDGFILDSEVSYEH